MKRLRDDAPALAHRLLAGKPGAVALDFDGTLTEIVPDPDAVWLAPDQRDVLARLARIPVLRVAVLSGRSREDAGLRLGVPGVLVVGNHGFELDGWSLPEVELSRPALASFLVDLDQAPDLPFAVRLEDKGATATVHLVGPRSDADRDRLLAALTERLGRIPEMIGAGSAPNVAGARGAGLRLHPGKASVEIRPAVEWDKARALLLILETWGVARESAFFAGDDETDECVFAALAEGIGVKVGEGETAARYRAEGPAEVWRFLYELTRQSESRFG